MAKRFKPSDQLTGGSGDVNPTFTWFSHTTSNLSANVDHVQSIQLPPPPMGTSDGNSVMVYELLKVTGQLINAISLIEQGSGGSLARWIAYRLAYGGKDSPGTGVQPSLPSNRCLANLIIQFAAATAAPGFNQNTAGPGNDTSDASYSGDLTDGDGHGVILYGNVLTSTVWKQLGDDFPANTAMMWCITYRMKRVSLNDYVIGQSSQSVTSTINN